MSKRLDFIINNKHYRIEIVRPMYRRRNGELLYMVAVINKLLNTLEWYYFLSRSRITRFEKGKDVYLYNEDYIPMYMIKSYAPKLYEWLASKGYY